MIGWEGFKDILELGVKSREGVLSLFIGCGINDGEDEVGVGGGGGVGDLAPCPQRGAVIQLLAPCYSASDLYPWVGEVIVSCGVVWGYDGGVGGDLSGLCHEGTGKSPVDGFGGGTVCG